MAINNYSENSEKPKYDKYNYILKVFSICIFLIITEQWSQNGRYHLINQSDNLNLSVIDTRTGTVFSYQSDEDSRVWVKYIPGENAEFKKITMLKNNNLNQ